MIFFPFLLEQKMSIVLLVASIFNVKLYILFQRLLSGYFGLEGIYQTFLLYVQGKFFRISIFKYEFNRLHWL